MSDDDRSKGDWDPQRTVLPKRNLEYYFTDFVSTDSIRPSTTIVHVIEGLMDDLIHFSGEGGWAAPDLGSLFLAFLSEAFSERQEKLGVASLCRAFVHAMRLDEEQVQQQKMEHYSKRKAGVDWMNSVPELKRRLSPLFHLFGEAKAISDRCSSNDNHTASRHVIAALIGRCQNGIPDELAEVGFDVGLGMRLLKEHLPVYDGVDTLESWDKETKLWTGIPLVPKETSASSTPQPNQNANPAPSPTETGGRNHIRREAQDYELCLDVDSYAQAIADTFTSASEENDFVFALYGPWGRGKSTLMKKVSDILRRPAAEDGSPLDYVPVVFSAWKYPTRPEVWVHLYQRIAKTAQQDSFRQKLRIGFRIGLLKSGWWPLFAGLSLFAVSRLQIDFSSWLAEGLGAAGLLIFGAFVKNISKTGPQLARSYFSMPDHSKSLGLQAAVGEDLKNLLKVWIQPKTKVDLPPDKRMSTCDFSRWPARWLLIATVGLVWVSVFLVYWKLHRHLEPESARSMLVKGGGITLRSKTRPDVDIAWKDLKLQWTGSEKSKEGQSEGFLHSKRGPLHLMYGLLVGFSVAVGAFAIIIAKKPKQHERVLLVIDDLDRCAPDQMLAVIESLRLFLDDEEMSRRLQIAMLIDRSILSRSILKKARDAELIEKDDPAPAFVRQQEEKLFVVSLELPPLNGNQAEELAKRIVKREYLEQITQKINAADIASREPDPKQTIVTIARNPYSAVKEGAGLSEREEDIDIAPGTKEQIEAVNERRAEAKRVKEKLEGERLAAVGSSPRRVAANSVRQSTPLPEVMFSDEEQELLANMVSQIDVSKLTPRSYRAFVLRYQLVRLILRRLHHPFEAKEIIPYLAVRFFAHESPAAVGLDSVVWAAVGSVTGGPASES